MESALAQVAADNQWLMMVIAAKDAVMITVVKSVVLGLVLNGQIKRIFSMTDFDKKLDAVLDALARADAPNVTGDGAPDLSMQALFRLKYELLFKDLAINFLREEGEALRAMRAEVALLRQAFRLAVDLDASVFLSAEYQSENTIGEFFKKSGALGAFRDFLFANQDMIALNPKDAA